MLQLEVAGPWTLWGWEVGNETGVSGQWTANVRRVGKEMGPRHHLLWKGGPLFGGMVRNGLHSGYSLRSYPLMSS